MNFTVLGPRSCSVSQLSYQQHSLISSLSSLTCGQSSALSREAVPKPSGVALPSTTGVGFSSLSRGRGIVPVLSDTSHCICSNTLLRVYGFSAKSYQKSFVVSCSVVDPANSLPWSPQTLHLVSSPKTGLGLPSQGDRPGQRQLLQQSVHIVSRCRAPWALLLGVHCFSVWFRQVGPAALREAGPLPHPASRVPGL